MLIVTVPPMASNFFQGTLGNFMHYSAFSDPQAHRGADGRVQLGQQQDQQKQMNNQSGIAGNQAAGGSNAYNNPNLTIARQASAPTDTAVRTNPQFANAPVNPPPQNS